jgi:hypothetical protein
VRTRNLYQKEEDLHSQLCQWLRLQHPTVIFRTDFAAGLRMTMGQAAKHKSLQSGRAWPDLFLAEPRGQYHGLFIELKREGVAVYLKSGQVSSNPHIQEQDFVLQKLRQRGYMAEFCVGIEAAMALINRYLKLSGRV